MDGTEKPRRVQFCKFFRMGICCFCVHVLVCLKIQIRFASFGLLCETSWPFNRVDPEEIVLNFNKFQSMAPTPRVVSILRVGVDPCKHGQMLIRL